MIFGDMGDMVKKVREMQEGLKKVQEELKSESHEASSEGITCVVRGDMEIENITIDPKLADPKNVKKLEKTIIEVVGHAMKDAKNSATQKLKGVTGGLSIPGLF